MNPGRIRTSPAFTRLELVVLMVILALLVGLAIPMISSAVRNARRISCVSYLKQIGTAARQFSLDHRERFPWHVAPAQGGSKSNAWFNPGHVYRHFLSMSNELGNSPYVLHCLADRERTRAPNFAALVSGRAHSNATLNPSYQFNRGISYFVGLDAHEDNPQSILSGDRNLSLDLTDPKSVRMGISESERPWLPATNFFTGDRIATLGFDRRIHQTAGNLLLGDGSVQQVSNPRLQMSFQDAAHAGGFTSGFLFPNNPGAP